MKTKKNCNTTYKLDNGDKITIKTMNVKSYEDEYAKKIREDVPEIVGILNGIIDANTIPTIDDVPDHSEETEELTHKYVFYLLVKIKPMKHKMIYTLDNGDKIMMKVKGENRSEAVNEICKNVPKVVDLLQNFVDANTIYKIAANG